MVKQRHLCALCGGWMFDTPHVDHVVPLSRGGAHVEGNLQLTHAVCNLKKGART